VVFGLKHAAEHGLGLEPAVSVIAGVLVSTVFVRRQRKLEHPLIELQLFKSRTFTAALLTYMLDTFAAFGAFVFIAQYLQLVLGLSPLEAGLWSLPSFLSFVVDVEGDVFDCHGFAVGLTDS
jgi:DHA2 family multidrug resistance protein-like MFS transporter